MLSANLINSTMAIIAYFLVFGGCAFIALYIILVNLFAKQGKEKILSKWLIVFVLSSLQTGCWVMLEGVSKIGGGSSQIYGGLFDVFVLLFLVLTIFWLIYCPIKYFFKRNKNPTVKEKKLTNSTPPTAFHGDTSAMISFLAEKGYEVKSNKSGWLVKEPLGGKQIIHTLEELEQYAMARTKV